MYTVYEIMEKFQYDKFGLVVNGKVIMDGKKFSMRDLKDAIQYGDTIEDKALDLLSEEGVAKIDLMQMLIYIEK